VRAQSPSLDAPPAKDFRDAIVHASTSFPPGEDYPKKEHLAMGLDQAEVTKIVDTVVELVERIETVVNGQARHWLLQRDGSGMFPDKVFE